MLWMPAGSSPFIGSSSISSSGSPSRHAATPEALAHAHRVPDDLVVGPIGEPHPGKARPDPVFRAGAPCRSEQQEVLPPGQVIVETRLVDDGSHPGERPAALAGHGDAEQRHRPAVRPGQPEQGPDQRRLAGAVRPEAAEGAPPRDEQFHVVDGDVRAEALREPVGLDGPALAGVRRTPGGRRHCRLEGGPRPARRGESCADGPGGVSPSRLRRGWSARGGHAGDPGGGGATAVPGGPASGRPACRPQSSSL